MKLDNSCIRNILVIKLRAIGDVVLSTVVLQNLREAFPHALIDFLTEQPSREVVEGNPNLNSAVVFKNKQDSSLKLILEVRRRRYDLVIDLFGNPRSALITLLSGAHYRVGYRFTWRQYCYSIVVEPRGGRVHNTEFNLDALRAIDVPCSHNTISFPVDPEAEQFADRFLVEAGLQKKPLVALNPGGGWYTKRWRLTHFAELGDCITSQYGAAVLLIWGPGEEKDVKRIQSLMHSASIVIPRTNLRQLAALLKRCDIMVTNDSGPMHIAAAVKTPVLAIFGPTRPELQGPYDVEHEVVQNRELVCLGCNYTSCPIGNPCMEELTVGQVLSSFDALLHRTTHDVEQPL